MRTTNAAGTTAINLTGNELTNIVTGNAGANVLNGGGGNDTLTGNGGNDIFVFNTALSAATNVDIITDFAVANDTIRLENAIFTASALPARSTPTPSTSARRRPTPKTASSTTATTGALYFDPTAAPPAARSSSPS